MVLRGKVKWRTKPLKSRLSPCGEDAWYIVVSFLAAPERTTNGNLFSKTIAFLQRDVVALVAHQAWILY